MGLSDTRVAVWGTFDVDNYGDHLFPKVATLELRRRGDVRVDLFSPFGRLHPTSYDSPPAVQPLGDRRPKQLDAIATAYDAVLVGGGELIHLNDRLLAPVYGVTGEEMERVAPTAWFVDGLGATRERRCPVLWNALGVPGPLDDEGQRRVRSALAHRDYIAVRDPASRARLLEAGVVADIEVVPDTALLVDRLFSPQFLDAAAADLRCRGHLPDGAFVAVQGCDLVVPRAIDFAAAVTRILDDEPSRTVVLVETGRCRGDGQFADAIARHLHHLGRSVTRMPAEASLAEVAAALRAADGFVGTSLHGAVTAAAFGRPFVLCNAAAEPKLDGFGTVVHRPGWVVDDPAAIADAFRRASGGPPIDLPPLRARIDAHFDRLAQIAASSTDHRPISGICKVLRGITSHLPR